MSLFGTILPCFQYVSQSGSRFFEAKLRNKDFSLWLLLFDLHTRETWDSGITDQVQGPKCLAIQSLRPALGPTAPCI